MMESANLDLVRSIYADLEHRDLGRAAEWAHPEIEFVVADGPEAGSWAGPARMAAAWRGFWSAWEDARSSADEYRELDNERVLVLTQTGGRGKTSGLQLRAKGASLFHVQVGKVTRWVIYWDRERALADLGLASEGDVS
jgi:ketosteroid isomerase-like protein